MLLIDDSSQIEGALLILSKVEAIQIFTLKEA
jgi:hypothetical protein